MRKIFRVAGYVDGGTSAVRLELALKNFDTLWRYSRTQKLVNYLRASRLSGHRNFPEQIYMPNVNLRQAEGGRESPA
jgi:hypothetical protein